MTPHEIVSQKEWLVARKELLTKEKELTKLRDQLNAERRALPWVRVEKSYGFDAPEGKVTLAQLFDGRSQLAGKGGIVEGNGRYHTYSCACTVHE